METKKINDRFSFVNEAKNTRNGFSHKSTLFQNDVNIGSGSCQYLNRTWESYRFQTSMKECVHNIIKEEHNYLIDRFKIDFNKNRTTKQEKDDLFATSERIKELNELLTQL